MKFFLAGFMLTLSTLVSFRGVQAAPGLRAGVILGATYTKFGSSPGYTGALGYPVLGVGVVANFARFSLRSYLESQKFLSTYSYTYGSGSTYSTSVENDLISFTTLPSFHFGPLYVGVGGGWGYSREAGTRRTFPWLAFGVGFEVTNYLFLEVRPQFDMEQASIFSDFYVPITLGLLFFDAPK